MRVALLYFTKDAELIAKNLTSIKDIDFTVYDKATKSAKEFVEEYFDMDGIVFIGAVGIAVRLIAPFIKTKDVDPAVIVIDELGQYVIPILSGHIGGANNLANLIANQLGTTPIITTATDLHNKFAVDVWSSNSNCIISNISNIKHISSAILRGEDVGFKSDFECINELPNKVIKNGNSNVGIMVSLSEIKCPYEITLNVIPHIVTLGVGCKKNTDCQAFENYILQTLKEQAISLKSVKQISSIDLKKEEECINYFSNKYKIPFHTYTLNELLSVDGKFTSSDFVKKTTGVDNVCERSAMYGNDGQLILKKQSKDGMTIAISSEKWRCKF